MRALYIIVIALCFLALRGHNYTFAKTHQNHLAYSPARVSDTFADAEADTKNQHQLTITGLESNKASHFVIDVDDDDDYVFARKYVLQAKYYALLTYALVFSFLFLYVKIPLPAPGHLSRISACLYLKQGVLRI